MPSTAAGAAGAAAAAGRGAAGAAGAGAAGAAAGAGANCCCMVAGADMWMSWGSLASKASFFLTESLNFLLLSSSSTMSVEWTIL